MMFEAIRFIDLNVYENRYVFALKTQQLYTIIEDVLKAVAKTFENHIHDQAAFHRKLLHVMMVDIPSTRPAVLSDRSYHLLDKLRSFRHFIRHGYDYELDADELLLLQKKLNEGFEIVIDDITTFDIFLDNLLETDG